jgi:hypothetical protein
MEQIFDFQFSKEVYIRPSTVQANKGGEVTDFVIQVRYTTCIVPKGCFPVTLFFQFSSKGCFPEFDGVSLKKVLLPGPDLMNSLLGILIRFCRERVGVMCDLKQMFYSFYVNHELSTIPLVQRQ